MVEFRTKVPNILIKIIIGTKKMENNIRTLGDS